MNTWYYLLGASLVLSGVAPGADETLVLENDMIRRELIIDGGKLRTGTIQNKIAKTTLTPTACDEFFLRISQGTHTTGTDINLTAGDFDVVESQGTAEKVEVTLKNAAHGLTVKAIYTLAPGRFYGHKQLEITSAKPVALERVDIESISFEDADQPYKIDKINAIGAWSPGLGQPLFTTRTATFWGTEFPASRNVVEGTKMRCGYLWGKKLVPGTPYKTHKAVFGAGDDPKFISDAFLEYIDEIRIRPLRLQVQYNCWFDLGRKVTRESFRTNALTTHNELVVKRGCKPLAAYVIDDGWQDSKHPKSDWDDGFWPAADKFDPDLASTFETVKEAQSTLGLWYSIGSYFGSRFMVPILEKKGYESLGFAMSMAGPKYMAAQEKRLLELVDLGVTYFKFDGTFGQLSIRPFEVKPDRGVPVMPQLIPPTMDQISEELNNPKYNEAKMYYLTAGTERLMEVYGKMHARNPDLFLAITNGAFLSPWWLMSVDVVWLINSGDAASGAGRTGELVYRDATYYEIWRREHTQFPMNSIFNHEPKKKEDREESREEFTNYLLMNMSRGTSFIELYIRLRTLKEQDWDALADGVQWAERMFPCFKRVRMHGGDPLGDVGNLKAPAFRRNRAVGKLRVGKVYGYTGWTKTMGYLSVHNPNKEAKKYTLTLDRSFSLIPGSGPFRVTSPVPRMMAGVPAEVSFGDQIAFNLKPGEIRVLDFHAK